MPKPPGAGKEWVKIRKFNESFPKFIGWLTKYHEKALDVLGDTLDNEEASVNLRHSAAKEVNNMYLKFHDKLRDVKPEDFVKIDTGYQKHKKNVLGKKKGNITPLIQTEFIPEENDTGT
jgi:hypothetical protein